MLSASQINQQIESTGVVAIIRASGSGELVDVVNALRDGGLTCIEVTMTTPNALEVIKAVTTIAKSLDIWTVAEGVEEPVQAQWLKDYDCSCGQGYLFSRPATPDELENLVLKMNSGGVSSASA